MTAMAKPNANFRNLDGRDDVAEKIDLDTTSLFACINIFMIRTLPPERPLQDRIGVRGYQSVYDEQLVS
jgi:hypothetical protein